MNTHRLTPEHRELLRYAAERNYGKVPAPTRTLAALRRRGLVGDTTGSGRGTGYALLTPAGYDAIDHQGTRYASDKAREGQALPPDGPFSGAALLRAAARSVDAADHDADDRAADRYERGLDR